MFNVRDFGAIGDSVADDGAAIRAAIAAATASGQLSAEVLFPAGHYTIGNDLSPAEATAKAHVLLDGLDGVALVGTGDAVLEFNDLSKQGIVVRRSSNITVKDLALDYQPLPFTQGRVVGIEVEGLTFDWQPDTGHASPLEPQFDLSFAKRGFVHWEGRHLPKRGTSRINFSTIEQRPDGVFRFTAVPSARGTLERMEVGDAYTVEIRTPRTSGNAIRIANSTACTLDGVTVHSAPACALYAYHSDSIKVVNSAIEPPAGSDRLMSVTGDGFHFKFSRQGPLIEGCRISAATDDCVALGTMGANVFDVLAPDRLVVALGRDGFATGAIGPVAGDEDYDPIDDYHYRVGDAIRIIRQKDGTARGEARIAALSECVPGSRGQRSQRARHRPRPSDRWSDRCPVHGGVRWGSTLAGHRPLLRCDRKSVHAVPGIRRPEQPLHREPLRARNHSAGR